MALTKEHLRAVMTGTQEDRVEELRKVLEYPVKEFDREGSRFWYLRPGESKEDAADTWGSVTEAVTRGKVVQCTTRGTFPSPLRIPFELPLSTIVNTLLVIVEMSVLNKVE